MSAFDELVEILAAEGYHLTQAGRNLLADRPSDLVRIRHDAARPSAAHRGDTMKEAAENRETDHAARDPKPALWLAAFHALVTALIIWKLVTS